MKNLNQNYNKTIRQIIIIDINIYRIQFPYNLIGFDSEFSHLPYKHFKCFFKNVAHNAYQKNSKLHKKYPWAINRKDYKHWLKKFSRFY